MSEETEFPPIVAYTRYTATRVGVNRTNKPGTCLYCGEKLKKYRNYKDTEGRQRYGQYGDNAFCSLSCAAYFGLAMANGGERLVQRRYELGDEEETK